MSTLATNSEDRSFSGRRSRVPTMVEVDGGKVLEIRIAHVGLVAKLDALGAALVAIRESHRDEVSAGTWAALNVAQEQIAEAIMRHPRKVRCGPTNAALDIPSAEQNCTGGTA